MSQENVEMLHRTAAAFNRGDIEGALKEWAPDAVWDWTNSRGFNARVFRGHDDIRALWERFLETFDEVRVDVEDVVEVRDGLLIEENVSYFRGRDGVETQARSAWLITFRDGRLTSLTLYQTMHEALEAAGLQE
jgi:ketosteroid isomerase-like protein